MKKEHQIIMLPSEKPSQIHKNKVKYENEIRYELSLHKEPSKCENDGLSSGNQHLYILSDEEIKKGDWYYNNTGKAIEHLKHLLPSDGKYCKKIIATTDSLLKYVDVLDHHYIDKIPKHIIEAYVKKPFDKVMVEYEEWTTMYRGMDNYKPKLNPDGTLTVSLVEEKMYSREKVEELCRNAHLLGMKETLPGYPKPETIDEWIKENL